MEVAFEPSTVGRSSGTRKHESKIMHVRKRDGSQEPVDVTKIIERVARCSEGIPEIDPLRVATKAISGLYDGATTRELDELCIQTASLLIAEDPQYSKLAARLLNTYIEEEVRNQQIKSFNDSIRRGFDRGLIAEHVQEFVHEHRAELSAAIRPFHTDNFEYFGLRTVFDRYLLKDPKSRTVIETPQYFFMRVACGLAQSPAEAIELYRLISAHDYMPSTPTLFNSGTLRPQMSSCYLLDSPADDLRSIYQRYMDIALLSKFAGGIGLSYSRIRSRGSLIKGTNGHSNGIVPWLKTLDSSVSAVNQGGKRKGAACIYLESWHADVLEFLELRDNTGDDARRTHNLNLANWVPDIFMRRVRDGGIWSLFDPKEVPEFTDLYGEEFDSAYLAAEAEGRFTKQIPARDLYARMMKTLAQTGNGWMTFKDSSNLKCNQTGASGKTVHLSNLCTEIIEISNADETAVCNLGSVNLARHIVDGRFDFEKLGRTVETAVRFLDRVIDINFYPIPSAEYSNNRWRPVGLGVMGLQDAFFQLRLPFDSEKAKQLSAEIQEHIYFYALKESCRLAEEFGHHELYPQTRAAQGFLQMDLWLNYEFSPKDPQRWENLRERIRKFGLRNSLLIAIAPTATIASIVGSYEAIEPQVSNVFKRETLSGEFLQVNRYLVEELKSLDLWNDEIRSKIKMANGSIQNIVGIPDSLKQIYRTVWEVPMKSLIDMAAERAPFIDQSQSLNLFMESPTIGKLSSMYMYAWEKGLKTTYYLRSRPATEIAKTTVHSGHSANSAGTEDSAFGEEVAKAAPTSTSEAKSYTDSEAIACSLENPEACEACQ